MYSYTRPLGRVPSPQGGSGLGYKLKLRGGVDEHRRVVADALSRSEWSAKRSRSEREADHERRSVNMCKKYQVFAA